MRWFKPNLRSSIYALLGHGPGPSGDRFETALADIRTAMLDLLGEQGQAEHPALAQRLRRAGEVETLWYARSEVMAVLAAAQGEAQARRQVESITPLFQGLLPPALCNSSQRRAR